MWNTAQVQDQRRCNQSDNTQKIWPQATRHGEARIVCGHCGATKEHSTPANPYNQTSKSQLLSEWLHVAPPR